MDTERFDRLSRLIGNGSSRRQVLIGLLGGILGAALGRTAALGQGQTPCQLRANQYRTRASAICLDLFRDSPENVFVCTADFDNCADLYATCADAEALSCARTAVTYWQDQVTCQNTVIRKRNDFRSRACIKDFGRNPADVFTCIADFDKCVDFASRCQLDESQRCLRDVNSYWSKRRDCQKEAHRFRGIVRRLCLTAFKEDPASVFTCTADFDVCADLTATCALAEAKACKDTATVYWKAQLPANRSGKCAPGAVRALTHCDVGCLYDEDCPTGEVCDFISGHCLPACGSGADCPTGQACEAGWCVAIGCASNDDCPSDQVCQSGLCVPDDAAPSCTSNAECPVGQVCSNGLCVPCGSDAECSAGHVCDAGACVTGTRLPGGSATLCPSFSDAECPAGQVCSGGACVPGTAPASGCVSDDECHFGDICAGGVCVFTGECIKDNDCPSDRPRCNDQFACYNPADLP
jgi:Cys-rich repeat protein